MYTSGDKGSRHPDNRGRLTIIVTMCRNARIFLIMCVTKPRATSGKKGSRNFNTDCKNDGLFSLSEI